MQIIRKLVMLYLAAWMATTFAAGADQQHRQRLRAGQGSKDGYSLMGTVKDADRKPLAGAIVLIPGISDPVETGPDGAFRIDRIAPGRHGLEVYAPGYLDFLSEFSVKDVDIEGFEVLLVKNPSEEIVVTATRTPRLYAEVPVKTEVISARDIDVKQANQLAESLALTTGVRVENNCLNCNFTQVRINGMEGRYSQILIDSSPVFGSMIGVYGLEQIPTEMIDRIEVVKGGGSALYGGNAVAGIINVLTRAPRENGSLLRFHQEASAGEPFFNLGFQTSLVSSSGSTGSFLFANTRNRKPVDINGDGFSEIGRLKGTSFGFNFFHSVQSLRGQLKVNFLRLVEDRRGGNAFDLQPHQADVAEAVDSNITGLSVEWNQSLSDRMFYNLGASYIDASRNTYYGSEQDINAYGSTQSPILTLSSQLNWQTGGHLLSAGVQAKAERLEDLAQGYGRSIDDDYREIGFYVQDDMRISRVFSLLAGLRATRHSLIERTIFNPRMSVLVNLLPEIGWRTTFSSGFRAPQVFDEDLHITQVGGQGVIIQNAPDLKEESSYGLSTGIDFGRRTGAGMVQFSAEGFFTVLNDVFVLEQQETDPEDSSLVFQRINSSGARVYGLSLEFGYRPGAAWNINTGWTFQRSLLDEPEPDFASRKMFRTPDSYGYVQFGWQNEKIADLDLSLDYTGPMAVPHFAGYIEEDRLETSDSFWVINARLSRVVRAGRTSSVKLFVGAFNLLNAFQRDLDIGLYRDAGYLYGPSKPRSLYTGFEFSF